MLRSQRARRRFLLSLAALLYGLPFVWGLAHAFLGVPNVLDLIRDLVGHGGDTALQGLVDAVFALYGMSFFLALFAVPVAVTLRLFARRRFRAQRVDVFAKVRAHFDAHPAIPRVAATAAGALVTALAAWGPRPVWDESSAFKTAFPIALLLGGVAVAAVAHVALRTLIGSFEGAGEEKELDAEGMHFSAVAVTFEAKALVAAFAVATLAVLGLAAAGRIDGGSAAACALAALAAPLAFGRASRIALGVDGVLIKGTSRTRFFAYRDVDEVDQTPSGDVVLRKAGRDVVRLQVFGADAAKTPAIVARLRANIARTAEVADDGAQRLAEQSPVVLAHAARGDGNYRVSGATREALWEILESGASTAKARTAAARALADSNGEQDRLRLRIAAEQCADPSARAELLHIAEEEAVGEAATESSLGALGAARVTAPSR